MPDLTPPPAARYADPDEGDLALKFDLYSDLLPSGRDAKVLPMRGPAERALTASLKAADSPATIDHMVRFFQLTIDKIAGEHPSEELLLDLPDEDVRVLMLRIRYASFPASPLVEFKWNCEPPQISKIVACGHEGNVQAVDLSALDFLPLPERKPIALPVSHMTAAWMPNTLRVQKEYLARRSGQKRKGDDPIDLGALFTARRVQLDGKLATAAALDLGLIQGDRSALRKAILQWGGVDSRVSAVCAGTCRSTMRTTAERLPGFFFPELVED